MSGNQVYIVTYYVNNKYVGIVVLSLKNMGKGISLPEKIVKL